MAGTPRKRAKREAEAAKAAGLTPAVFVAGEQTAEAPPKFVARAMSVDEFEAEGKRQHVLYTEALGELVCEGLACGVPLAELCSRPGMPSRRGVYGWRRAHPAFAAAMDDARRFRAESRADVIDGLLQDMEAGKLDPIAGRAIIDGHKWLMSKENVRYGDVQKVELSGRDGGPINILEMGDSGLVELARFAAFALRLGQEAEERISAEERPVLELAAEGSKDG